MVEQYGAGLSSARFICGTQDIHLELEKKVAELHNAEDAILYAACFDANAGIFEVVLNKVIFFMPIENNWTFFYVLKCSEAI